MITIIAAGYAHGYSRLDHWITGHECDAVVGRRYPSVATARRAADRAASRHSDPRVRCAPIWMDIRFDTGETRQV